MREIGVWTKLRHPNVVQFYGSILETSLEGGPIRTKIITDWCEEGPVIEYVRRNPDVDRHRLGSSNLSREYHTIFLSSPQVVDICKGLAYLHSNDVVHGNVKPV